MGEIILTFIIKLIDCAGGTMKNIFLINEKYFLSSVSNSISALANIGVAVIMARADNSLLSYMAIAILVANFVGSYYPAIINNRLQPDNLRKFIITADTFENGCILADLLRNRNIAVTTQKIYDKHMNKTLSIEAFSQSKAQSRIILKLIPQEYKFHMVDVR